MAKAKTKRRTSPSRNGEAKGKGRTRARAAQRPDEDEPQQSLEVDPSLRKPRRLNRTEIEDDLTRTFGLSKESSRSVLARVFSSIQRALLEGRAANLQNICTIEPYKMRASRYRHPRTGEIQDVAERPNLRISISGNFLDDLADAYGIPRPKKKKSKDSDDAGDDGESAEARTTTTRKKKKATAKKKKKASPKKKAGAKSKRAPKKKTAPAA